MKNYWFKWSICIIIVIIPAQLIIFYFDIQSGWLIFFTGAIVGALAEIIANFWHVHTNKNN